MMSEYEITNTKMEYTGKAWKYTITFLCDGELFTVVGFSDMMSLARMYAEDEMTRVACGL
jgi:hypothetical protein